jgi:hypothetical protein
MFARDLNRAGRGSRGLKSTAGECGSRSTAQPEGCSSTDAGREAAPSIGRGSPLSRNRVENFWRRRGSGWRQRRTGAAGQRGRHAAAGAGGGARVARGPRGPGAAGRRSGDVG